MVQSYLKAQIREDLLPSSLTWLLAVLEPSLPVDKDTISMLCGLLHTAMHNTAAGSSQDENGERKQMKAMVLLEPNLNSDNPSVLPHSVH